MKTYKEFISITEQITGGTVGFTKRFGTGFGSGNVGLNASVKGRPDDKKINVSGGIERGEFSGQGDKINPGIDAAINNFNTGSNDDASTSTIKRGVQGNLNVNAYASGGPTSPTSQNRGAGGQRQQPLRRAGEADPRIQTPFR